MRTVVRRQRSSGDSDYIIETNTDGRLIIEDALYTAYSDQLKSISHLEDELKDKRNDSIIEHMLDKERARLNDIKYMQNIFRDENIVDYNPHSTKSFHQLVLEDVYKNYIPQFTTIEEVSSELFNKIFDVGNLISFKIVIPLTAHNYLEEFYIDKYNITSIDKCSSSNRLLTIVTLNLNTDGSYIQFLYRKSNGEISSAMFSDKSKVTWSIKFIRSKICLD